MISYYSRSLGLLLSDWSRGSLLSNQLLTKVCRSCCDYVGIDSRYYVRHIAPDVEPVTNTSDRFFSRDDVPDPIDESVAVSTTMSERLVAPYVPAAFIMRCRRAEGQEIHGCLLEFRTSSLKRIQVPYSNYYASSQHITSHLVGWTSLVTYSYVDSRISYEICGNLNAHLKICRLLYKVGNGATSLIVRVVNQIEVREVNTGSLMV